jgi:gliding motility-associated-like protein
MKSDDNGNLFAGGHYFKSAEFGSHVLQGSPTNENASSLYISKFDLNGNVDWAMPRVNNSTGNSIDNVLIKNNTVYVTGQDGLHVFIYEYSTSGNLIRETMLPSFRGDLAGGFGIDSQDSLYVSGRINDFASNKTTAFILKLGVGTMPLQAGAVNVALMNCALNGIKITTDAIEDAHIYQWEILYNTNTVVIETAVPSLVFMPGTYNIDGECQVRVRGKNANGEGTFSPYQTIHMDFALSELQIEKRCDKIVAKSSDSFNWFFNGVPASYPDGQIEISPQEGGEYYIKHVNACGQQESNILKYIEADKPYIPNIITPNNDAFNEFFVLPELDDQTSVYIYNRWGTEVFHSIAYTNDWNGGDLPSGVYFYLIKNSCLSDMRGPLTITR